MKRSHRTKVNTVAQYLEENGITFEVNPGGKHIIMFLYFKDSHRRIPLSNDEGHPRGLKNFFTEIKKHVSSLTKNHGSLGGGVSCNPGF
jgi:hypothetical protein